MPTASQRNGSQTISLSHLRAHVNVNNWNEFRVHAMSVDIFHQRNVFFFSGTQYQPIESKANEKIPKGFSPFQIRISLWWDDIVVWHRRSRLFFRLFIYLQAEKKIILEIANEIVHFFACHWLSIPAPHRHLHSVQYVHFVICFNKCFN